MSCASLVQQRKLSRQKLAGQFLYCAADRTRKAQQLSARRALLAAPGLVGPMPDADLMPDELRAAIVLFASLLDERQRRLYAGLESLKCGWGGDARIAGLLGIDPGTVARGRKQLLAQDVERARVRRPGGGRPPLEKNSRADRRHRSGLEARCRRRSHHRYPLDAPHHREDIKQHVLTLNNSAHVHPVLLIDEAHLLSTEILSEIRLLTLCRPTEYAA